VGCHGIAEVLSSVSPFKKRLGILGIKDLGVMLDIKLYFHCHVDFVYSQALRTLGLINFITYNFSSLDSLVLLYIALIRSKLEYASVVWNKLTLTDSNKTENIQIKFVSLCYCFFFSLVCYIIMI
jgi:hypothetical protein